MDHSPLLEKLQQLPPSHDDDEVAHHQNNPGRKKMDVLLDQLKKVTRMAAPMVVVSVTQYLVQVVSLMMSGHLGELSLSGVAIATSFTNVTGFALLFGLAGALETLCGQAYGAEQYWKCGTYTYASIISLVPICVPVSILWYYVDDILVSIGQDPEIASVAGQYAVCLIPALFGDAVLQPLNRYFQSQGLTLPMLLSSVAALCGHVPVCWALVYKFGLGNVGAALAIGLAYWFNAGLLVLYMRWAGSCEKTRGMCWDDLGASVTEFWRFAVPSAVMVCLTTTSLHYYVQYGIGAAASTGVSNELGAGNPEKAKAVIQSAVGISILEAAIVSTTLFCCRSFFGYVFSNEKAVVAYVADVAPLLCLSVVVDSFLAVLSATQLQIDSITSVLDCCSVSNKMWHAGVARGSGWQYIGAYVNLGAYYGVGMPVAVLMCFVFHLEGKGLWVGILTASTLQAVLLAFITAFTNWDRQAEKARERIFDGNIILPA
ncbi:unnamed protein product [Linum tenue]|uniref:Protein DETOXIFICATION n=1 Tax=Linum tenue TaxID=586396 RepID=A0AAV0MXN1_9ROSI|nr:unnamed protein product [Linum tenue]